MHVLPDFREHDRHAGVLADRTEFFARELLVFDELREHILCGAAVLLFLAGGGEGACRIIGKVATGTQTEPANGFNQLCGLYETHAAAPPFRMIRIGTHRKTNYRTKCVF